MMKVVKITFTLPEELATYVETRSRELSREEGEPVNISRYVRDLIREDKKAAEKKKAA